MTIEDEIIFQRYHINGYRNPDAGVCDDTTGASPIDDERTDCGQGLDSGASGYGDA